MAERATVTFHTSPKTKARLEKLASVTRRSKSFLTNEAVEQYLAAEEEFVASVEAGIAAADAGDVLSSNDLLTELKARIDAKAKAANPA